MIATARIVFVLVLAPTLAACNSSKHEGPQTPAPAAIIEAIPPVDPARYELNREAKQWQNPYLLVRPDGVGLVDSGNNEIIILKPEDVPAALAKLPATAWPYGRVVAIAEVTPKNGSEEELALVRKNRAILAGTLQSLHVLIHWIPKS